jgi:hypothetical protein
MRYAGNARLAYDALRREPTEGIPIGMVHIMEHSIIERLAGTAPGSYRNDPHGVYIKMLRGAGVCMVDQYIADNPLTMDDHGWLGYGAHEAPAFGSPEDVAEHIERVRLPELRELLRTFDPAAVEQEVINHESMVQALLGPDILKAGYGQLRFPTLDYGYYGYEPYFAAFALYPDVVGGLHRAQADYHERRNAAVVKAYQRAGLPLYHRLDHDIADSRGLLTGLKALERDWLPGFERSIRPAADAGFTLLWHCDGNLMELVPPLLACGVNGFQGFQYEDGMDYINLCKMKDRNGAGLVIQAGVSVTRELPMGTPADVRRQVDFLVENGPATGLFLQFSSSCVPGTPFANIQTAIEAMRYYRTKGRLFNATP